jgi:hypothetical protein
LLEKPETLTTARDKASQLTHPTLKPRIAEVDTERSVPLAAAMWSKDWLDVSVMDNHHIWSIGYHLWQ